MAKDNLVAAGEVLYTAAVYLRIAAVYLEPVMPSKAHAVLDILGATENKSLEWGELKSGTKLKSHEALFPRIEVEKSKG